MLQLTEYQI